MAKRKKAQDGTALPRSLDPKYKAAIAADKQRTDAIVKEEKRRRSQGTIKATKPFKAEDTRSLLNDRRAKERADAAWNAMQKATAVAQYVPHPLVSYSASALNSAMGLTDAYFANQEGDVTNRNINLIGAIPIPTYGVVKELGRGLGKKFEDKATRAALIALGLDVYGTSADLTDNFGNSKKQQGGSVESRMGGLTDKGFNYNGAWGGQFQMGGVLPGAIGNMYARHGAPSEGKYAKKTMPSAQDGAKIPVIEDAGSFNKEGVWIPDWEKMTAQAKKLGAKKVRTKHGSVIYFNDKWEVSSVDDNPDAKAQDGASMSYYQAGLDFQPKTISKKGSKIKKDNAGYWNPDNWGEPVEIDSPNITMEGVYQPLIGVSDTGDVQYMEPGENYTFDGESVTEYPVMQKGGRTVSIVDYLKSVKLDSSKAARKKLAQEFGIQNYDYSSKKNLELLKALTSSNAASAQPKTLAKGVVDLMIPKAYFNPKVSSPNMKLQQISNTGGHPNTLARGVVDIIVPQYRTAPKVGNKKPSLRSISTTSSRPAPIVEEPNPFIEGISELYNNSVDYLSGLASGIQRKYEQMQDEDVSSIVKKPVAPTDPTKYGYQELYAVPDVGGEPSDSLVAFTNTFDNSQGGRYYVGNKVKEVTDANARRRFENTHGVGHFLRDSDILPNQKITPESWNTVKGFTFHTTSPGKTVSAGRFNNPSWYRMLYRRDPNDQDPNAYSIKYMRNKDVSKIQDQLKKEGWNLDYTVSGQHRFSDLDWNKEGPSTGYASKSKWVPLKNSDEHSYIPYKNKDGFSRFSGGSGVYVFKDPKTNKEIGVDVAGSVNTLRQVGEELINSYNLKPEDLTLVYHDMGSYSAKPKSKEGILDYNQWLNFNTYNKGFSGAPLIIRKKEGGVVTEYPIARKGVSVNKADEAPLKKLDNLLNFTNYNDMKKAKKGKNIPKAQPGINMGTPMNMSQGTPTYAWDTFNPNPQPFVKPAGVDNYPLYEMQKQGTPATQYPIVTPPTSTVNYGDAAKAGLKGVSKIADWYSQIKGAVDERKKARQLMKTSELVQKAAGTRPEQARRQYNRPEDNLLQPDQMGMMPYGTGYDVLGMAEDGMQIGGNLTEIQNMYSPGTLYDNLGYEPLDESSKVKQFRKGGNIPVAQAGAIMAALPQVMEKAEKFMDLPANIATAIISQKTKKWTDQANRNLGAAAMQQGMQSIQQGPYSGFMKDGGSLDVSDEYKWVSHIWQPQVITKFGEYNVGELLKPDDTMDTLRTGGNIRSNYMGDDEKLKMMAMGGNLQTHWGGKGEVMSYNPYMPGSGETVMLKGNSHEESDGQGNTGIGMSYSGNMVEAERGEPVVEMQEGGSVDDTSAVVFGNMKIPSYGVSELQDSKAKGKKFKTYASDLAKKEKKQSKIVDKATSIIDNIEGDSPYDMLKMNAAQAMLMGADMSLKDLANKKKTLAGVQNAILDTAEEMGLESDALARGKMMQAKKGANIPKGQQGVYIPQPGLSSNLTERKRLVDAGRKIIEDLYNAGETGTPPNLYTDEDFLKIGEKNVGKTLDEVKVVGRKKPTAPRQLSESVYLPTMEAFEKAYKDVVPKTSPSINQQGFNLYIPTPGGVSPNMGQLTFSERQSAPITPTASVAAPVSRKVQSAPTKKQTTAAAKQQTAAKQETPAYTPAYNAKTLQANLSTPEFMQPVDFSKPARMPYYTPEGLPSDSRFEDVVSPSVYDITDTDRYFAKDLVDETGVDIEGVTVKEKKNRMKNFLSKNEDVLSSLYNEALPYLRPSNQMQLQPEQLMGEMFALSTNVLEPVPFQSYQPLLETRAPQISAQEQLNQNQADFNAMLRQVGNNPSALSVLAAQKQAADRQAIAQAQAINTQQAIAANNRNIAMLNDATVKNLGALDAQYQRQTQAKAVTKAQAQSALSSIASKIGQNKLENLTSAVMQNMYNFRFGPKGRIINYNPLAKFNIPDVMTLSDEKAAELQKALDKRKGKTEEARNGSIVKAIKGL